MSDLLREGHESENNPREKHERGYAAQPRFSGHRGPSLVRDTERPPPGIMVWVQQVPEASAQRTAGCGVARSCTCSLYFCAASVRRSGIAGRTGVRRAT